MDIKDRGALEILMKKFWKKMMRINQLLNKIIKVLMTFKIKIT